MWIWQSRSLLSFFSDCSVLPFYLLLFVFFSYFTYFFVNQNRIIFFISFFILLNIQVHFIFFFQTRLPSILDHRNKREIYYSASFISATGNYICVRRLVHQPKVDSRRWHFACVFVWVNATQQDTTGVFSSGRDHWPDTTPLPAKLLRVAGTNDLHSYLNWHILTTYLKYDYRLYVIYIKRMYLQLNIYLWEWERVVIYY